MGRQPEEERPRGAWPHHGRKSPWPSALLAASILSSCVLWTEGLPLAMHPPHPVAGQEISLFLQPPLGSACSWYRETATGTALIERTTVGPSCSLHIWNITPEDSGIYKVQVEVPGGTEVRSTLVVTLALQAFRPPDPILSPFSPLIPILMHPPHPVEGGNVTLMLGNPLEKASLCFWFRGLATEDKNQILTYHFPPTNKQDHKAAFSGRETSGPGCYLHIRDLTSGDTGNYTVQVDTPGGSMIAHTSVVVSAPIFRPVPSNGNAVLGVTIGSLAVIALIVGTLLYFFLRARGQRDTASRQNMAAPPAYENVTPSRQGTTDSSACPNNYETLQHPTQSVYQQLNGSRQAGQVIPLS